MAEKIKKSVDQIQAEMDAAALEAEQEVPNLLSAADVAAWWKRWYMRAGHKRLGRLLVHAFEKVPA